MVMVTFDYCYIHRFMYIISTIAFHVMSSIVYDNNVHQSVYCDQAAFSMLTYTNTGSGLKMHQSTIPTTLPGDIYKGYCP